MIRRDYILRMLAEFFEVLSRIRGLQKGQLWDQARQLTDQEFHRLVGLGAAAVAQLSETELLARVIQGETSLAVREKTLILATLLKEAGEIAAGQEHYIESRAYHLKGLDLLLGVLAREDIFEFTEFVPRVEAFVQALSDGPLPLATQAMLMQQYERSGAFGKAEDILFSMMEEAPQNASLLDFGIAFYQRLRSQSDDALAAGNLPRGELEAALAQLVARKAATPPAAVGEVS